MNQHLAKLWLLPEPELQKYLLVANKIAELRATLSGPPAAPAAPAAPIAEPPAAPAEKQAAPGPRPEAPALPQRPPMRPPKPGSLRASVHDVLRDAGKPMRRCEIIRAVAQRRGVPADDNLKANVGEALINRHDHFLARRGHGVYALAAAPAKEAQYP